MSTISASIEETNRQRAALGLPPLAIETAASRASNAAATASAEAAAEEERRRVDAIRAELARRKEKRLVERLAAGQSLGESLVSQTAGSARDWIARSRKIGLTEAQRAAAAVEAAAAAERARASAPNAYTSNDLAGAKVAHDYAEFEAGSEVVLTLKDSRILKGVADGLNDEEDELLNQDLVEREKLAQRAAHRKGRTAAGRKLVDYDAYGAEEEELLAKYTDPSEQPGKTGLRLGAAGALTATEVDFQSNSALYQQDEARKAMNQLVYSLDDGGGTLLGGSTEKERKFQSDYKEVKFKKKKKTTTASNAAASSIDDAIAGATTATSTDDSTNASATGGFAKKKSSSTRRAKAPTASLLDFLPEPSPEDRAADHASRTGGSSARAVREAQEEATRQAERDERYLRAIQASEAKSAQRNQFDRMQAEEEKAAVLSTPAGMIVPPPPKSAPPVEAFRATAMPVLTSTAVSSIPPPPPPPQPAASSPPPGLFEEEEDQLLAASLARARRLAQQKQARVKNEDDMNDHDVDTKLKIEGDASSAVAAAAAAASTPVDSVRALADQIKQEQRVKLEPGVAAAPALPPGMRLKAPAPDDGSIVLTMTTEFVRGLQTEPTGVKREGTTSRIPPPPPPSASSGPAAMDVDGDGEEQEEKKSGPPPPPPAPSSFQRNGVSIEDVVPGEDELASGDEGKKDAEEDDEESSAEDEADNMALKGVAAALRMFKARGILKEGGNGRGDDPEGRLNAYGAEKYDAFGREQSKKEQFRYISHKFHGIEAGLTKQAKRLNRVQQEAAKLQAIRERGGMTEKLLEKQKAAGAAHLVLDKKLGAELAQSTAADVSHDKGDAESGKKQKKRPNPFAAFGHGRGNFAHKRQAQLADAARKAEAAAAAAQQQGPDMQF